MLFPLMLLLVVPGAEPNEAEKLFRQMESKVMQAKTLECVSETKTEATRTVSTKGTLLLGEGNKFRLEESAELITGKEVKLTRISDGTKTKHTIEGVPSQPVEETPKWAGEAIRLEVARAGAQFSWSNVSARDKEYKVDDCLSVKDFKLGKKEMVDKQEAQVVHYELTRKRPLAGKKQEEYKFAVSVWINTKTQLPLKRVTTYQASDQTVTVTETFSMLSIDGKIDPKQFELPKE